MARLLSLLIVMHSAVVRSRYHHEPCDSNRDWNPVPDRFRSARYSCYVCIAPYAFSHRAQGYGPNQLHEFDFGRVTYLNPFFFDPFTRTEQYNNPCPDLKDQNQWIFKPYRTNSDSPQQFKWGQVVNHNGHDILIPAIPAIKYRDAGGDWQAGSIVQGIRQSRGESQFTLACPNKQRRAVCTYCILSILLLYGTLPSQLYVASFTY